MIASPKAAPKVTLAVHMAKEEGCRFYLGSDAHHPAGLTSVHEIGPLVCGLLGLEAKDQFVLA